MILLKLKQAAERFSRAASLGCRRHGSRVLQRRAASGDQGRGQDCGALNVLRVINEPTAAALAYGLDKKTDETIAV